MWLTIPFLITIWAYYADITYLNKERVMMFVTVFYPTLLGLRYLFYAMRVGFPQEWIDHDYAIYSKDKPFMNFVKYVKAEMKADGKDNWEPSPAQMVKLRALAARFVSQRVIDCAEEYYDQYKYYLPEILAKEKTIEALPLKFESDAFHHYAIGVIVMILIHPKGDEAPAEVVQAYKRLRHLY
jgi:hypothetical protein